MQDAGDTHTHTHTECTFLAVQPLEAQGAVTLIALLPGSAAAPMGTGGQPYCIAHDAHLAWEYPTVRATKPVCHHY